MIDKRAQNQALQNDIVKRAQRLDPMFNEDYYKKHGLNTTVEKMNHHKDNVMNLAFGEGIRTAHQRAYEYYAKLQRKETGAPDPKAEYKDAANKLKEFLGQNGIVAKNFTDSGDYGLIVPHHEAENGKHYIWYEPSSKTYSISTFHKNLYYKSIPRGAPRSNNWHYESYLTPEQVRDYIKNYSRKWVKDRKQYDSGKTM